MACRMGAVANEVVTPLWQVAHVTGAADDLACWAIAACVVDKRQTTATVEMPRTSRRALFGQIKADLSLACGIFAVSALGVNRNEPEMGFKVTGIALDDLLQQFFAALHSAGFCKRPAESELGHLHVRVIGVCALGWSERLLEAIG